MHTEIGTVIKTMGNLFSANAELKRLDIPDAEIYYQPHLSLSAPDAIVLQQLIESVPWRAEDIVVWGRRYPQPRLVAWFGDEGTRYTYSDISLEPLPWSPLLSDIRARVEAAAHTRFNSVLLNYYRNHRDSMGMHSDDEPELGFNPIIASLSLGEQRTFVLKHKTREPTQTVRLELESGSLLLMKGATQQYWKHGINKLTRPCGPRINLTFRRIIAAPAVYN
jgi:alkylated DNA repair dioxygenase AlkB